jgi:HEAT repeat protein
MSDQRGAVAITVDAAVESPAGMFSPAALRLTLPPASREVSAAMTNPLDSKLATVFTADRALRAAEMEFLEGSGPAHLAAIERAVGQAEGLDDAEESAIRLMRAADLLGEFTGPEVCTLLLRLLNHDEPAVRDAAGTTLLDLGYSRYAEVARAIEKLIDDGKALTALKEVPFVLAEIGEPGGVKLCLRLIKHPDAGVTAAAVEALAMLGDPSVIKDLEKLRSDKRVVEVDGDDDEGAPGEGGGGPTVGDLVGEALEHLRSLKG